MEKISKICVDSTLGINNSSLPSKDCPLGLLTVVKLARHPNDQPWEYQQIVLSIPIELVVSKVWSCVTLVTYTVVIREFGINPKLHQYLSNLLNFPFLIFNCMGKEYLNTNFFHLYI